MESNVSFSKLGNKNTTIKTNKSMKEISSGSDVVKRKTNEWEGSSVVHTEHSPETEWDATRTGRERLGEGANTCVIGVQIRIS